MSSTRSEKLLLGGELERTQRQEPAKKAGPPVRRIAYLAPYETAAMGHGAPKTIGFTYEFTPTPRRLELQDEALSQLYICFGAPGTGKSYFLMKLLRQLADDAPWESRWGGLLIDPKGTLLADVRKFVPRPVYSIGPASRGINLLRCSLKPRDLGVALTMAAQAAGITSNEAYWTNELKKLFGAGLLLLSLLGDKLTLSSLADLLLGSRTIDRRTHSSLDAAMDRLDAKVAAGALSHDDQRRAQAARTDLVNTYQQAKGDNAETVKSFVGQVLSPFLDPDLDYLSDKDVPGSIGDMVFREAQWVALELPKSMLAVSRFVSSLAKILYQQSALMRFELYPSETRRVFLIIDEYAEVASDLPGERLGDSVFYSQMRQFRVLSFVATQGVPMLKNSGVKETWETMMSNSAAKIFFRVGDHETAELATKSIGEGETISNNTGMQEGNGSFNRSSGSQIEQRSKITTDLVLTGLARGQCVVVGTLDGNKTPAAVRYFSVDSK